jgi:hypothetical protein
LCLSVHFFFIYLNCLRCMDANVLLVELTRLRRDDDEGRIQVLRKVLQLDKLLHRKF